MSTDLRDGNQALIDPVIPNRKTWMFELLAALGCKEIEIDLPSASQTDFDFVRQLIIGGHVPEDMTISMLIQAREDLTARITESLIGVHRTTIHMYNATAELFRRVVFDTDETEYVNPTMQGTELVMRYVDKCLGEVEFGYQYSPGTFIQTPTGFIIEVRNAVAEIWQPDKNREIIFSLPVIVERSTPNIYADRVEYFYHNIGNQELVVVSLHPHNDRGTTVATAELGQTVGADRMEGYLFRRGEHAGNVDLVTLALNLYTQGIDPQPDFHDINRARHTTEYCTGLPVHPRQPYIGGLMHTAFSGSHQNIIKKGLEFLKEQAAGTERPITEIEREAPYLPIDSHDIGRNYRVVIWVNLQSGKGGAAYPMKIEAKMELPRRPQMESGCVVQQRTNVQGGEFSPKDIANIFPAEYLPEEDWTPTSAGSSSQNGQLHITVTINSPKSRDVNMEDKGNEPASAFVDALAETDARVRVLGYSEHTLKSGGGVKAAVYMECELGTGDDAQAFWGVSVDPSITNTSMGAILSALNRAAHA